MRDNGVIRDTRTSDFLCPLVYTRLCSMPQHLCHIFAPKHWLLTDYSSITNNDIHSEIKLSR